MEEEPTTTPRFKGLTVEECDKMIQKSLRRSAFKDFWVFGSVSIHSNSEIYQELKAHLEKSGCIVGDNFIKAIKCNREMVGGYVPGKGVRIILLICLYIVVCSNHIKLQDDVNQVIINKLINAYDDCRAANLDWNNCAHHACSSIRAGHLSGDCHYKREFLRGFMKLRGHEQDCVRRRVMKSVTKNPNCSEAAAKDAMEAVWDICYNDTMPFDRAP
ncbi:Peptidase M76, ATP23 [Corchorus olitorius]|uniref:Mitochondrial inner membrane protease ATP23 n=1 Tax=Corchorus olitorius TaxID=93759 RepID=A0A1R3HFT3_9ROSI|nr:Peptidase M76, ATP23 [Corchorus olitorius]